MTDSTISSKYIATVVLLIVSAIGVTLPHFLYQRNSLTPPTNNNNDTEVTTTTNSVLPFLSYLRPLASGIIIGVALFHLLPEAGEILRETSSTFVNEYPTPEFLLMLGFFLMVVVDEFLPCTHKANIPESNTVTAHKNVNDSDNKTTTTTILSSVRETYKLYAMEVAVSFHSLIIGFSLGVTNQELNSLIGLTIALSFHQLFEGIAMGLTVLESNLSKTAFLTLVNIFSFSIAIGSVIGINVSQTFAEDQSSKMEALIIGVPNTMAAGMLLHMGGEFLSKDFGPHSPHKYTKLEKASKLGLVWFGGGAMAIIAFWA